jgi:DNA-binding HxlR family transcriptional regulator
MFGMESDPLALGLARVGDRWSMLIVSALLPGPLKYGELSTYVEGIAPNILASRLRRMERDGLLVSTAYSERPVRMAYELTETGRDLAGALSLLADWGARANGQSTPQFHDACGGEVEQRLWCRTCERVLDDGDVHHFDEV